MPTRHIAEQRETCGSVVVSVEEAIGCVREKLIRERVVLRLPTHALGHSAILALFTDSAPLALRLTECQRRHRVRSWHSRFEAANGDRLGTVPATTDSARSLAHHGIPRFPHPDDRRGRSHVTATTDIKIAIKPLDDRIVVRPLDAEQTTASGLVIPDTAKEKPQEGEVLAVGPGRWDDDGEHRIPLDVSVGDVVLYSKYGGTEVKYSGDEYLILSGRDVLAIITR
jgi:chaperonin GroES